MPYVFLVSMFLILLLGCTSKEQQALMQKLEANNVYHGKLKQTEKTQLFDINSSSKALVTATYLYEQTTDKNDTRDEIFIVGVYLEGEVEHNFESLGYALTLNEAVPISIKKLDKNDVLLKDISFVTQWASYYLVHFPHNSKKSFTLTFKSKLYGEGALHFAKVAKYVLTKTAF
ncbi:MAG: hypothetical protein DRQ45_08415 [Gammaproteobacteria bacterium]|nr:MAG: hypothetical protein DRQ45_08415 [Gammaproteobacteria bacterium]RLA67851.1 MAG: hypothetical protein DRQ78_02135 [Campylobacterota bacterium]